MTPADDERLPSPPEALLALLRDAEARFDDASGQVRRVREALEAEPRPLAASVAGAVLSGEGVLRLSAPSPMRASLEIVDVAGVTDQVTPVMIRGEEPATSADPQVARWLVLVAAYAATGTVIVTFIQKVVDLLQDLQP